MGGYFLGEETPLKFPKQPTSIAEQIKKLQGRGMEISEKAPAEHYLTHISYYRMTAYWLPFEADHETHQFKPGTTFEKVLNLYIFDRELRLLLMDAIERIEISVRTKWMNVLVEAHGPHAHLNPDIFRTKRNREGGIVWSHENAVSSLEKENARSREVFIRHLRRKYEEKLPPLWATCELMTFGEFSKWFANTASSATRNQVARFYGLDETILVSFLHHLAVVRNLCAHHGRLWNREFTFTWKLPKKSPVELVSNLHHTETRRLYNSLAMLGFLMDQISPHTDWKIRVLSLIRKHGIDPSHMGFPSDYETYPLWNRDK